MTASTTREQVTVICDFNHALAQFDLIEVETDGSHIPALVAKAKSVLDQYAKFLRELGVAHWMFDGESYENRTIRACATIYSNRAKWGIQ